MRTRTLKPGLLVALKTSVDGGVNYSRIDLDPEHSLVDHDEIISAGKGWFQCRP